MNRVKRFVANRVLQIKDNNSIGPCCYIPTKENPAGGKSTELNTAQVNSDDSWFQGFSFMWHDMKFWKVEMSRCRDPKLKKDITSCSTLLSEDIIVWKIELQVG